MLSSSETSVQITNALEKLIDSGISLGERVLGALIIFIVGKFLVNWLNRLFARILEKRKVDPSIQSFLKAWSISCYSSCLYWPSSASWALN